MAQSKSSWFARASAAYYGWRRRCFKKCEYAKAIADFTEAIRLDPKDAIELLLAGYATPASPWVPRSTKHESS
jgi:tetratricopeptide (TPR) repeat protein